MYPTRKGEGSGHLRFTVWVWSVTEKDEVNFSGGDKCN